MRSIFLTAVLLGLPLPATAQCPGWSPGFDAQSNGTNGYISAMAVFDDGHGAQLYAAGSFASIGSAGPNIARFDGEHWHVLDPLHAPSADIYALAVLDDGLGNALFAIGDHTISGVPGAYGVTRWDGASWTSTGSSGGREFGAAFDPGTGMRLYTVNAGGLGVDYIESYDAVNGWVYILDQSLRPVQAAAVGDLGSGPRLFLTSWDRVNAFDGSSITSLPLVPGPRALAMFDDGNGPRLYVAGGLSGPNVGYVRRYNGSGWVDVAGTVLPTTSGSNGISALVVHDFGSGPRLVAAGKFSSIGGVSASSIAVWDGTSWSPLGSGLGPQSASGTELASFDAGDATGASLYVTGAFTHAGGVPSDRIARYTSCGGPATAYCFGDGSATACPCGNASAVGSQSGCLNSFGVGGTLRAHGQARITHDTLALEGAGMTNSAALYFQGANLAVGGQGFQIGDGVKCVAGPFVRLGTKINQNGASQYPAQGDPLLSVKGMIASAGTRYYQVHYRNSASFCTSATFNMSSAMQVVWAP